MTYDLDDPTLLLRDDVLADPRPLYDVLRRRAPVWRLPGQETYLVSDPSLIREAVGRPKEFSSNLVSLLYRGPGGTLVPFPMAPLGDPTHVLAVADPPVHTRQRRLLQPHLSAGAVARLEPTLREVVDRQIAPMRALGRGDIVTELSDPVPALAICLLLGLPPDDAPGLIPVVADVDPLLDGVTDADAMATAVGAALRLHEYVQAKLDLALGHPADQRAGLLGVLADAIDAGALPAFEALGILVQLFSAGTETTSSLIANAIEILARRPDLQRRLRENPERIPGTLDDVLRDDGPFQFHYRWTTSDTTLGDVSIPAGSRVLLMWAAANRPSPAGAHEEGKTPSAHYAFGRGLHFCIGEPLARLESRIAIERLLAGTSRIALDPDHPPVRRRSILLRRHASLPVTIET
jgi:cytochrome P450